MERITTCDAGHNVLVDDRWYQVWNGGSKSGADLNTINTPACIEVMLLDYQHYGLTKEQAILLTVKCSAETLMERTSDTHRAECLHRKLFSMTLEEIVRFALGQGK